VKHSFLDNLIHFDILLFAEAVCCPLFILYSDNDLKNVFFIRRTFKEKMYDSRLITIEKRSATPLT